MPVVIAATFLIVPFIGSEIVSSKRNSINAMKEGSNTCFTRVGQSFTALMIQNFNSPYLSSNFIELTGECFSQLNATFDEIYAAGFAQAKKPLNKLVSDLFWFHEKTEKMAQKASEGEITISTESNLVDKFTNLEALNISFQEALDNKTASLSTWRGVWTGLSFAGALALAILALVSGSARRKERETFDFLNSEARDLLESNPDLDMLVLKTGRVMDRAFAALKVPFCYELYTKTQNDLLETRSIAKTNTTKVYNEEPAKALPKNDQGDVADFGNVSRALVERLSDKIFTHGIVLEENLEDDFWIKGNSESLEQLLYNLFSFSIENSLHHNSGRKITIKSKALGGISYFKAKIANYLLNPEEMELFNGGNSSQSSNVNLLLLKEIATDMGASLSAKNILNANGKFTGAEIEVVFNRARMENEQSQTANKVTSVMKGSKKEILQRLRSEV